MSKTEISLAFDVYGTLVDPHGLVIHLERFFDGHAQKASEIWRDKQIEYSFRRALMNRYLDFDTCTAQALAYVSERMGVALSASDRDELLARYRALPAFPEAGSALRELKTSGYDLVAFSNGTESSVRNLLDHADLLGNFGAVISVDDIQSFKPDPLVYAHLAKRVGLPKSSIWLISSNPFDVIGATSYGLRSAWVRREEGRIFDPWEFSPDLVVRDLSELPTALDHC